MAARPYRAAHGTVTSTRGERGRQPKAAPHYYGVGGFPLLDLRARGSGPGSEVFMAMQFRCQIFRRLLPPWPANATQSRVRSTLAVCPHQALRVRDARIKLPALDARRIDSFVQPDGPFRRSAYRREHNTLCRR
jgi:hypothetical protein